MPAPRPMPVRLKPERLRLTFAELVADETAITPVLEALVRRLIFGSESAAFATMAPPWETTRKRPAS